MQVIKRRRVLPRTDNTNSKDIPRDNVDEFSYFSTTLRRNDKLVMPSECELMVRGIDFDSVSLSFKIKKGLIIKKG